MSFNTSQARDQSRIPCPVRGSARACGLCRRPWPSNSFKVNGTGRPWAAWNTDGVVEAAGVEPASEKVYRRKATCVSGSVVVGRPIGYRQEGTA